MVELNNIKNKTFKTKVFFKKHYSHGWEVISN